MSVAHPQVSAASWRGAPPARYLPALWVRSPAMSGLVVAFLVYLVLEGALRKWVAPSLGVALFVVKDVLLLAAVAIYWMRKIVARRSLFPVLTRFETVFFGLWVLYFTGSAVASGVSRVSVVGLRYYLIMLPLVILVPRLIGSIGRLRSGLRVYLLLALPVGVLGVVQFISPSDALINRYAWEAGRVATFQGGVTRITGTFSYISPFTAYLQFMAFAAWGLLLLEDRLRWRLLASVVLVLLLGNLVLTGSRAPIILTLLLSLLFVAALSRRMASRRNQVLSWSLTLLVVLAGLSQAAAPLMLVTERNELAGDSRERVVGFLAMPVFTYADSSLFGTGIGSAFLGVQELDWGSATADFDEVTMDRIGIETGVVGYTLALGGKLYFLWLTVMVLRRLRFHVPNEAQLRVCALVSLCFQVSQLWMIPVYSSVSNAFYFLSLGLILWVRSETARVRRVALERRVVA